MGNHRLEHCQFRVHTVPPIVSETTIVEAQKQHVGVRVIQLFDASITTTEVETIVAPNIDVVRRGILIGSVVRLGNGLSGVLAVRNLNQSLALPTIIT